MASIRPRSSLSFVTHRELKRETAALFANVHLLFVIVWTGLAAEQVPQSPWWWVYVVLAACNALLALGDVFVAYRSGGGEH